MKQVANVREMRIETLTYAQSIQIHNGLHQGQPTFDYPEQARDFLTRTAQEEVQRAQAALALAEKRLALAKKA